MTRYRILPGAVFAGEVGKLVDETAYKVRLLLANGESPWVSRRYVEEARP